MTKYYVCGDVHQDFKPIREFYLRHNTNKDFRDAEKVLIMLGDFSANFFLDGELGYMDRNFKKKLGKYPFTYFVIRGNHEQRPSICKSSHPEKWHVETYFNNFVYVENDYPYIKYALDRPATYQIGNYKTIVFPGAYSVDKYYRLSHNKVWFTKEQMDNTEMNIGKILLAAENWKVDLILSHTCPTCYEPTDLFLPTVDQSLVDKTTERYLAEIERKLDYKLWCFGHYHRTRVYPNADDKQMLMLFNQHLIDLDKWMNKLPKEVGDFI